jgi:hypothetical protein
MSKNVEDLLHIKRKQMSLSCQTQGFYSITSDSAKTMF